MTKASDSIQKPFKKRRGTDTIAMDFCTVNGFPYFLAGRRITCAERRFRFKFTRLSDQFK